MADDLSPNQHHLNDASRSAVDALVAAKWNASKVPPAHASRAALVEAIVSRIGAPMSDRALASRGTLIDAVIARVMLSPNTAASNVSSRLDVPLSPEDEDAIDALFSADMAVSKVPASLRDRAERAAGIGRLVAGTVGGTAGRTAASSGGTETYSLTRRQSRIEATMARVAGTPMTRRVVHQEGSYAFRRIASIRMRDVASAAAAVVLGAVVLWPVISAGRQHAAKTICRSRLANVASAMGLYGSDFDGAMPMTAGFSGATSWWDVGTPGRSNSANLFTLASQQYAKLGDLACPGNPSARCGECCPTDADWHSLPEVSYSYAIPTDKCKKQWGFSKPTVILADASPVVRRIRAGERAFALENSPNHSGQGQQGLRTDGSVVWMTTPVVDGDNIWLPGLVEATLELAERHARSGRRQPLVIRGTEIPTRPDEIMLGP